MLVEQQASAGLSSVSPLLPLTDPHSAVGIDLKGLKELLHDLEADSNNLYEICDIQTHDFAPFLNYDITQCQGTMDRVYTLVADTYQRLVQIYSHNEDVFFPMQTASPPKSFIIPETGVIIDIDVLIRKIQQQRLFLRTLAYDVKDVINDALAIVNAAYGEEIARFDEQAAESLLDLQLEFEEVRNCWMFYDYDSEDPHLPYDDMIL